MQATQILMSEHRVIERVIAALETNAKKLQAGKPVRPQFFLDAASFVKGFADGCHHAKEENVLFSALEANGLSKYSGPLAVMLNEHEEGRAFIRSMHEAAQRLQEGDDSARLAVVENALGYATLLRQHIQKEDQVLFQIAARLIPEAQHAGLVDAFEHVEHEETGAGVHEKYLALAEQLEREAAQN